MIRFLDREADITTRYGGGFVQSIDGLAGGERGGRRYDWFFYVNGIESPVGAAEVRVHGGDRIWWDYRDWTDAMQRPGGGRLVAGALRAGLGGRGGRLRCRSSALARGAACATAADRLEGAGARRRRRARRSAAPAGRRAPRVLVGPVGPSPATIRPPPLEAARPRAACSRLRGPRGGRFELVALDPQRRAGRGPRRGAGLVAAVRGGDDPPTWLVTGTDPAGGEARRGLARRRDASRPLRGRGAAAARGRRSALPLATAAAADEIAARLRAPAHAPRRRRRRSPRASTSARSRSSRSPTRTRSCSPARARASPSPGSPPRPGARCARRRAGA